MALAYRGDGQLLCPACAGMLYKSTCTGCGRVAERGLDATGARHRRCEAGGEFLACDDQGELVEPVNEELAAGEGLRCDRCLAWCLVPAEEE